MIKSQSNVNMRKTCNFYCVVFVILFLEWILGIKNLLNLSGNDYIKEKRFANLIFEVCTKSQEISEENYGKLQKTNVFVMISALAPHSVLERI